MTAVVVGEWRGDQAKPRSLRRSAPRLAGYKLPKRVIFVDALPRNTMAKVQKNVLREQFKDLYA